MIYITFKGTEYEIPYDPDTLQLSWAIDSTFDNGYFETEPMEAGSGLDFSRRIPRDLQVRAVLFDREFIFRTAECYLEKYSYSLETYIHKINLISDTKDLTVKTLENMTLTQPKGTLGQFTHSVNQVEGYLVPISYTALSLINIVETNSLKIDDTEILVLDTYRLTVDINASNSSGVNNELLNVNVKFNGTSIHEETFTVPMATPSGLFGSIDGVLVETVTFNHTPSVVGTYTVEVKVDTAGGISHTTLEQFTLAITSQQVSDKPERTYAQLVDKMLRNTEYVLNPNSRSRLNLTAPEGKYERYMVFDGLQKIGGELRALVKVEGTVTGRYWKLIGSMTPDIIGESLYDYSPYDYDIGTTLQIGTKYYEVALTGTDYKGVSFKFFDNPSVFDPIGELQRSEQAELEDYVSALELNTENVIKPLRYSPHKNGWGTLRNIDGIGQMTVSNIGYELEDPIEKIISVKVKGFSGSNLSGTYTFTTSAETDITDYVVEKTQWDTFLSEADYSYSGKVVARKNNRLYYVQGDNKIYGMSCYGETESRLIGSANVTRALYETILTAHSEIAGERVYRDIANTDKDDPATLTSDGYDGMLGDLSIQFQVTYSNLTNSRARVYKDDQSGFERERIKYMNESANVNETDSIGSYAQQLVNRLGGTKLSISGVADDWSEIAELGDMDSQGRVYTLITVRPSVKIEYDYMLVQDYNVISSYIGVNSRHRVEEISSGSSTKRTLRYVSKLIFTDTPQTFSTRLIDYTKLLDTLGGTSGNGLNYGYLECNHSNGDQKKIHLSLDSDSKGKTIEIKWNMRNNFSAGLKRYTIGSSPTIIMNSDVGYTDYYGKVNDILFGVYFDSNNTYDLSTYPEASSDNGDGLFTIITDTIDKDAGEILQGLIEIPILSNHENIRVYDGFAKWNRLVEGTERIRAGLLTYTPIKNATRVNLNLIRDVTPTVTVNANNVQISYTATGAHKGIVFYNQDTLEMLLAYVGNLVGNQTLTLPYYIEDGIVGGGQNFVTFIEISNTVNADMILGNTTQAILISTLYYSDDVNIGQDEYELTELNPYLINASITLGTVITQTLESALNYSDEAIIGQDEYGVNEISQVFISELSLGTIYNATILSTLSYGDDADIGQDIQEDKTINNHMVAEILLIPNTPITLDTLLNYDIVISYIGYDWSPVTGQEPTVNQTCEVSYDELNVRCDTATPSACTWDTVGGQYTSIRDRSDNVGGSCLITPSTKTECAFLAGQWYCQDYEARITDYDYSDCFICTAVEVEE